MRFSIFWRLIIGYLVIFLLGMGVGVYALIQLKKFNASTRYIINVDNRLLEINKELEYLTISQHRFLKKYLITKDNNLYNQFLTAKEKFSQALNQASGLSPGLPIQEILKNLQMIHEQYLSLVGLEYKNKQDKINYTVRYNQERERLVDLLLKNLDRLEVQGQQDIRQRIKEQGETGDSARTVAIILAFIALCSVILISFLITRSITNPLNRLRIKTREISEGIYKSEAVVPSLPEISELAQAFNTMIHELSKLEKMKSDFFSTMSHELRTPLTSIKEGISLLEEEVAGPISEKQRNLLEIIAQESHRLIDLVNSSLDLSKMEAGMMNYHLEKACLYPLIEKVIHEMKPIRESKRIKLEAKIRTTLPMITIDQERILQALRNLIGNALKVTPDNGKVSISAACVDQGIQVAIKDTGPGITKENLSTIFNKFQQVSPPGSYAIKGTGLGLAIVKHIITSHGGKVWAESIVGQGSSFFFWLPV